MRPRAAPEGLDPRVHAAVTDIYTYVLLLEAEWRTSGGPPAGEERSSSPRRAPLTGLRDEQAEELDALRDAAAALREDWTPEPTSGR